MRDRQIWWHSLVLLLGVAAQGAAAEGFWVAPDGRDTPAGGSAEAPWATLQYAADRVRPGDTVTIRPGKYAGFILGWDRPQNGTAARPIRFRAEPGASIVSRNAQTPDGICLERASFIVIEGFEIVGMPRAGIRSVQNRGVVIQRNRISDSHDWGIFTSHSYDARIEANLAAGSQREHGIYVSNSGDRPMIRGNITRGNGACGIQLNGDVSQGGDGIISEALVERNVIYDNGRGKGGSAINCDGVQRSIFRNNLLYDNHASGISLFRQDGGGPSSANRVINNTIIQANDARWAINIKNGAVENVLYNNIILSLNPDRGSILVMSDSRKGFASDYNVLTPRLTTNDGWTTIELAEWQGLGYDKHSMSSTMDTVFAKPDAADYHLGPRSPAIDAASQAAAPSDDLDGRRRPLGPRPDVGAYESGSDPADASQRAR